jgi:MoaA/NifB/PqqE/SkfB family radical SAM enzyme
MGRYYKSLFWAGDQFINRIFQDISYQLNAGYCKPSRIVCCLTVRCNLKCKQCAFWRSPKTKELTTEEWKQIILELRNWLGPYRMQIAGGEIFLRNDILDLIRFGHENGVLMGLVTNATLIDNELAKEIVESGLSYFDISLDGIRPETNDYIRGGKGVYEKVMATIQYIKQHRNKIENDLSVVIATVIMGNNMDELVDIVKFVEKENLDAVSFNPLGPPHDSGGDLLWYKKSELWPQKNDLNKLDNVLDELILLKKKGARILNSVDQFIEMKAYFRNPSVPRNDNCIVGVTNWLMSCDGKIHQCFHLPSIGNYKEPSKMVWNSEKAKIVRKEIKNCTHECSPGNFVYKRSLIKEIQRYLQYRK